MITAIFRFMNHLQFIFRVLLLTAVQLGTGELSQLVVSIFSNKIGEPLLELLRVFKPVVQLGITQSYFGYSLPLTRCN